MATVEEYKSGHIAAMAKAAVDGMEAADGPLEDSDVGRFIIQAVEKLAPMRLSEEQAAEYIDQADKCAVGERACVCMYEDVPMTEAVFLDELAEGMAEVGKAALVSKDEAKAALAKYRGRPIMITNVEGKYMEICRSWPKKCVYWNLEMRKVKCIERRNRQ